MTRALLALLLVGCGSPRVSEAVVGTAPAFTEQEARGEIAFMRKCNMCHPQGEGGVGGALNSKPFPGTMIRAKVRGRIPGDMPSFKDADIADDELDAIASYLKKIRKNDGD